MRISRNTERRKRRRTSAGCRQSADGRVAVLRFPLAEMGRGVRSCCTKRAMTGSPGRGKMPATRDRYRHSHPPTVGLYAYIAGPALAYVGLNHSARTKWSTRGPFFWVGPCSPACVEEKSANSVCGILYTPPVSRPGSDCSTDRVLETIVTSSGKY
jgi:hypothetical protein